MGGTSFDIGLVVEGGVKHYDFNPVIERWLVTVPMIHLVTLGAGGGSICRYDRLHGTVQVGPIERGIRSRTRVLRPRWLVPDSYRCGSCTRVSLDPTDMPGAISSSIRRGPRPPSRTIFARKSTVRGRSGAHDQATRRRQHGQRHFPGVACPRLRSAHVHHARLRRQWTAPRLRNRRYPRDQSNSGAPVLLRVLGCRGRQHASVAHPRTVAVHVHL